MCKVIVAEKPTYNTQQTNEFGSQLLPQCPNGCGVLALHRATRTQLAIVRCQACTWELALLPQEARDLTDALIGLNPTLDLTAFLAAVIRNAIAAADDDWRIHDEIATPAAISGVVWW